MVSPDTPVKSVLENRPDYTSAIGMINIEIGGLEMTLGRLLGAVLNVQDAVGQVLYLTPKSAFARLEILENVVTVLIDEEGGGHARLLSIVKRAKTILGKRHELIHGHQSCIFEHAYRRY
jgi:hypothetical protein